MSDEISNSIQVVPIAEEHIEGFHRCLDSVARERLYLGLVEAPSLASVREFVLSNIANDIPQFVAVKGREVVGWCDISQRLSRPWAGFTHRGVLGMGVHRAYRRRGIGERLALAAIERAKERDLERVELQVFATNTAAVKLYEKLGFVVEGVKKRGRKIDGVYDDIIEMVLFI